MPPTNRAAFLVTKNKPLHLETTIYTQPSENEIVVKNAAVAINPYDFIIQEAVNLVVSWVKLPFVLGTDVAGEIVEVGKGVTRFKIGDRVVAHAVGLDQKVNRACESGFQEYTVLRTNMTSHIPNSLSYDCAVVMPLGLSTAACALFQKDLLALSLPTVSPKPTGETVLIWGGSTSVGLNAIQLARAAGYEVISTASPHNHEKLKKLGAAEVFDYNSQNVTKDIIAAFENRICAGAISIGRDSFKKCIDIVGAIKGTKKFVAQATLDTGSFPKCALEFPGFLFSFVGATVSGKALSTIRGVSTKFINGSDLVHNELGKAIYIDYLPQALEQGVFVPAPEPQIVGHGLEFIEEAMNLSKKGVSAKKLVVTL